jgi:hypothetical protein
VIIATECKGKKLPMQKTATATFHAVTTRPVVQDAATHPVTSRPDGVSLVIGFYTLLGIGFLLGSLFMLVGVVLMTLYMANSSFFANGLVMLLITIVAGATVGVWMVKCAFGLWADKRSSRFSTFILASLMTAVSLLSIPALVIAYADGSRLGTSLIALALGIAAFNALAGWSLMRPEVKRYYELFA